MNVFIVKSFGPEMGYRNLKVFDNLIEAEHYQHMIEKQIPEDIENEFVEIRFEDENQQWVEVSNFSQSNEEDLHYTWDSRSGLIEFGPRVRQPNGSWRSYGAVPKAGEEIWVSGYRIGGGSVGT